MGLLISWLRNNLITVVEILNFVYDGVEIIINGLVRLFPANKTIVLVHDLLAKFQGPLKQAKAFLVKTAG